MLVMSNPAPRGWAVKSLEGATTGGEEGEQAVPIRTTLVVVSERWGGGACSVLRGELMLAGGWHAVVVRGLDVAVQGPSKTLPPIPSAGRRRCPPTCWSSGPTRSRCTCTAAPSSGAWQGLSQAMRLQRSGALWAPCRGGQGGSGTGAHPQPNPQPHHPHLQGHLQAGAAASEGPGAARAGLGHTQEGAAPQQEGPAAGSAGVSCSQGNATAALQLQPWWHG